MALSVNDIPSIAAGLGVASAERLVVRHQGPIVESPLPRRPRRPGGALRTLDGDARPNRTAESGSVREGTARRRTLHDVAAQVRETTDENQLIHRGRTAAYAVLCHVDQSKVDSADVVTAMNRIGDRLIDTLAR
jgi:hypothetical protein